MVNLNNLTPEDLLVLTNALALSLSKDRSIDEINSIGNVLSATGSLMMVIAAQQQLLNDLKSKTTDTAANSSDINH